MTNSKKSIFRFSSLFKICSLLVVISLLLAYLCPYVHPGTFWLLPFFGLAYPIILLIAVILIVIWASVKSKWALILLASILLGGKLHFRMISIGGKSKDFVPPSESLHVMSYNVRLFDLYTWAVDSQYETRDSIFTFLERESPDVVCFQEFYHQDKPTTFPTRDTLRKLLQTIDYHERYSHKLKGRQNFGIAILSKYPMIAKGDVAFPQTEDKNNNYCIFADIVKGIDTFRVYNLHLQSIKFKKDDYALFGQQNQEPKIEKSVIRLLIDKLRIAYPKRADQAVLIMEHVQRSPYPVILCGDFNDTPFSYTYNQFNKGLVDSFRSNLKGIGSTYAGKVPAGRIDYIFHSEELESYGFSIQNQIYSDHRAISCRIFKKST
jgi:endonuclease/exonuclease/phosphatase family metal-dependent hydrolase